MKKDIKWAVRWASFILEQSQLESFQAKRITEIVMNDTLDEATKLKRLKGCLSAYALFVKNHNACMTSYFNAGLPRENIDDLSQQIRDELERARTTFELGLDQYRIANRQPERHCLR